jgi:hypothetical protein
VALTGGREQLSGACAFAADDGPAGCVEDHHLLRDSGGEPGRLQLVSDPVILAAVGERLQGQVHDASCIVDADLGLEEGMGEPAGLGGADRLGDVPEEDWHGRRLGHAGDDVELGAARPRWLSSWRHARAFFPSLWALVQKSRRLLSMPSSGGAG